MFALLAILLVLLGCSQEQEALVRRPSILFLGQSGMNGPNIGTPTSMAGTPDASIPFRNHSPMYPPENEEDWGEFRALSARADDGHGPELGCLVTLKAAGLEPTGRKFSSGNTDSVDWTVADGEDYGDWLQADVAASEPELAAILGGDTPVDFAVIDQGENDSATFALASRWAERWEIVLSECEATTLATTGRRVRFIPIIVLSNPNRAGNGDQVALLNEQQELLAAARGGLTVDQSDLSTLSHLPADDQTIKGQRIAAAILELFPMTTSTGADTRDAVADLYASRVDAGSGPGKILIRDGATTLATITLADPSHDDAVSGFAELLGLPLEAAVVAAGAPDNYLCQDSDGNTVYAGDVSDGSDPDADMQGDSLDLEIGDTFRLTAGGFTAPD